MRCLDERYLTDHIFRQSVDMMEKMIHEAKFTPSEMREMAVLASIHYEMKSFPRNFMPPPEIVNAFDTLDHFRHAIQSNRC